MIMYHTMYTVVYCNNIVTIAKVVAKVNRGGVGGIPSGYCISKWLNSLLLAVVSNEITPRQRS